MAGQRWSAERDLADTLESLAVQTLLASAEREGRIDRVEDELFRFERIVAGDPGLRDTLSSRNVDAEGKVGLVRTGCSRARSRRRRRAWPSRPCGPRAGAASTGSWRPTSSWPHAAATSSRHR